VFVALVIQHETRTRRIILSFVVCLSVPYISTCTEKQVFTKKDDVECEKCVLIFCTKFSETFLIPRRIQRDIINVHKSLCTVAVFSCQLLMELEFSRPNLEKYTHIQFHKNPCSGRWFVPCARTDGRKLMVTFRNFANAHKIALLSGEKWRNLNLSPLYKCTHGG
jgi:hypothetical protein